MPVTRRDLVMAVLGAAKGSKMSPTQLQKALFLISENIPGAFSEGSKFNFTPYNYGPFDAGVYSEAQTLMISGDTNITIAPSGRWKEYAATQQGVAKGIEILAALPENERSYIIDVVQWVQGLTFEQLVKTIYEHYPQMRANSIFRG